MLSTARAAARAARPLHRNVFSVPGAMMNDPARNSFPMSALEDHKTQVLLLRGDSDTIGKEATTALSQVLHAANVPISFVTPKVDLQIDGGVTQEVVDLFSETRVAVKGPYFTPISSKSESLNIQIRRTFDLFANVVHAYNMPGVHTRHKGVDIVMIRENTEGEYSGLEHSVVPGVVESLKIITEEKSMRIAQYAFQYALANNRKKVTAVHKANIMKSADGLFLECCRTVANKYPFIHFESMIVDNTCMQLASRPQQFDVMVMPNLYGNIVTGIATGLVGGPGLVPGVNVGMCGAVFEQGSRHAAKSLAGRGVANPTATILSGALMLRYLKMNDHADRIEKAVTTLFRETNYRTRDMVLDDSHKDLSTQDFTKAVIDHLETS
ncbi:Isocitrate dehydrogenase [NAD] regulatory subunit B, mitochondrial [Gracilariopsis chorda]|uniref:Isocitrate dehydrogenase [NAD] regulatory subunit B, mitochondrial n=1 Tax=Gracilariopsis chorda TaxID=448386 RepID=A0A2V3IRI0_9FLOR|nr:Isocitrate dehydrogenase [NAD] regulatory subunit B, mitochondrial [Gracilariopsis chorda]|eukprot:PXF44726.1 Isocitrate dehydrogenase [NAD] regulatory subunit B, mitochondrial [Gracilariopsis chorda]